MSVVLKNHIAKFTDINEKEFSDILSFFQPQTFKKKQNLLEEGQVCKSHYFVEHGCLRKFFINAKGVEQTTAFAIENWWMTDHMTYERQLPTEFYIQAVENTDVLTIDSQAQEKLLAEFPKMERYFRFIYQRAYAALQMRVKYLFDFTKEESYYHFSEHYSEFVQRVPQYLLASYLGFTPEYLSEIRNKRRS